MPVPATASAQPRDSVGASATSARPTPPRPPLPEPPPGVEPEDFTILASLCSVAVWNGSGKPMVGCRSMPPFDGPEEQPDGSLREAQDFAEVCFLAALYRGSFSGPGKEEVVLGLEPCGEARVNDIAPGTVVLAERGPEGWAVSAVEPATNVRGCSLSKRADRTLLVCADNIGAYGDGSLAWRFSLDFSKPPGSRENVFAKIYSSMAGSCMFGGGMLAERGATHVDTSNERFEDADGDGDEDLSFTVERAHVPGSETLGKKVDAWCGRQPPDPPALADPKMFAGKPKRFVLRFTGDKEKLVPTAETARLLADWGSEAPEFWWNVKR